MTEVFLGLGSNLGDREANLRRALGLLPGHGIVVRELSPETQDTRAQFDDPEVRPGVKPSGS